MIYIPVIIVITTMIIDLYFTSKDRFKEFSKEFSDKKNKTHEPWNKIEHNPKYSTTKYYIKINNINKYIKKLNKWTELKFKDINYISIDDDYIVFNTIRESDALVLCNLIINNLNNNITIDEIITNNLIEKTIRKAHKYEVIRIKLLELIKTGLEELNTEEEDEEEEVEEEYEEEIEMAVILENNIKPEEIIYTINEPKSINEPKNIDTFINNKPENNISKYMPYEGSEYATINF